MSEAGASAGSRLRVAGSLRVPGDKSISHRALLFAALSEGRSRIRGMLESDDVRSTAAALRAMGVSIPELGSDISFDGRALGALRAPGTDLNCGNSGTTTRLLAGVVSAHPFAARFIGDASLSRRPMRRVARPLEAMGARVELTDTGTLPMTVNGGKLRSVDWHSDVASAQVKSAILLAGLVSGVDVTVHEPARSRDHTERMLGALGAPVEALGGSVSLRAVERIGPLDIEVPGDPSSAAFLIALGALAHEGSLGVTGVCLNETRVGFLSVLRRMGARVAIDPTARQGGEPVGTITASASALRSVEVQPREVPAMIDELPLLACIAARAEGTTTIRGAGELRVKESDRIGAVVANLRALGAEVEELDDGMIVQGSDHPLRGRILTHGDHRLAMSFGILAALPGNEIEIDDPGCVSVSYPGFWNDVRRVSSQ